MANKGNKQYFIQIARIAAEEKACKREFRAFAKLNRSCLKMLSRMTILISAPALCVICNSNFMQIDEPLMKESTTV